MLITKGAPESILQSATAYEVAGTSVLWTHLHARCQAIYQDLSTQGYRRARCGLLVPCQPSPAIPLPMNATSSWRASSPSSIPR